MNTISVTPSGTALPVAPCPMTPKTRRKISDLWNKQAAISLASRPDVLARIAGNPVPKWSGK